MSTAKGKRGSDAPAMVWFPKKSHKGHNNPPGKHPPPKSDSRQQRGGSMVRELNVLTVGFVFAFLAAIVIGVF
jgi:hypothetical protein